MKKKKLIGKLSLNKSKISNLDGSKIMGGWHNASENICGSTPQFCTISVGVGCGISENTGSECKCL
jgi:hypothetical protein